MDFESPVSKRIEEKVSTAARVRTDSVGLTHHDYLRAVHQDDEPGEKASNTSVSAATGIGSQSTEPNGDKRAAQRHKCNGSVEFRTEGIDVRTWATVTDISRYGCYVEMQATSPLNTTVDLLIEVNSIRVATKGVVKTSYPLLGMGIAFSEISEADSAQLEKLLSTLAGGTSTEKPAEERPVQPSPSADFVMVEDPLAALNSLAKILRSTSTLTLEQFNQVVGNSQKHD